MLSRRCCGRVVEGLFLPVDGIEEVPNMANCVIGGRSECVFIIYKYDPRGRLWGHTSRIMVGGRCYGAVSVRGVGVSSLVLYRSVD